MEIIQDPGAVRTRLAQLRTDGKTLALVPTMGNLHSGHLALVDRARHLADVVAATIFVNPKQFGPGEDLDAYPRTFDADIAHLEAEGVELVFAPAVDDMYPEGVDAHTAVIVPGLTDVLCGASRPGHFDGVSTIVCKLLNLFQPDVAVFGEKDMQQLLIIRKLARDLALPVRIEGVATVRDENGLALSSRNGYLSAQERTLAPTLRRTLCSVAAAISEGQQDFETLASGARASLNEAGFETDYLEIRRPLDLVTAKATDTDVVIFAAARLGGTRLIDNLRVATPAGPPGT